MLKGRSRRVEWLLIQLALTLSSARGQVPSMHPPYVESSSPQQSIQPQPPSQATTDELISPLLQSIGSKMEPSHGTSSQQQEEQTSKRISFFKLLLERLEDRRTGENRSVPFSNHLTLTLRDASSETVNIEFSPSFATPDQQQAWNSMVHLLADSLAHVVNEAEHQGFIATFKYSISLDAIPAFAFSPGFSTNALKSAAG